MNSVIIFSDLDVLAEAVAKRLRDESEMAAQENRLYSIVLTGGKTASKIYRWFGKPGFGDRIPWELVHLFWTDERCVPPESQESNFGTAYRAFLQSISIPDENIHRINGEVDPVEESVRYGNEIQEHIALKKEKNIFFDWVLMGLGPDGHTASLFPKQEKNLITSSLCEVALHSETDQKRITLTPAAIKCSTCVTYHVTGQQKAEIVSSLVLKSCQRNKYPAAYIPGEWYLDEDAASSLERPLKK